METALVVTHSDQGVAFLSEQLNAAGIRQIVTAGSCGEASRLLLERSFDLMIINAPLRDETGEKLARLTASQDKAQVIMLVKTEFYDEITAICSADGVLTVAKPVNRTIFWSSLMLAAAASSRMNRIKKENDVLKQRLEDIRYIDKAKWVLIAEQSMTEQEAHRFIEKQSMDRRISKREVADGILGT